jgi:hypothetical protein
MKPIIKLKINNELTSKRIHTTGWTAISPKQNINLTSKQIHTTGSTAISRSRNFSDSVGKNSQLARGKA